MRTDDEIRFFRYVVKTETCWIWQGSLNKGGYGLFRKWENGQYRTISAHRYIMGGIDPKIHIDHLCRVRCCVNPAHLEFVSAGENIRRGETGIRNKSKTHCIRGHEFTPQNTIVKNGKWRNCKACDAFLHREKRRLAKVVHP